MKEFPRSLRKGSIQIVHVCTIPLFFLLFTLIYRPDSIVSLLKAGEGTYSISDMLGFNLSICIAIITVNLIITRSLLYSFRKKLTESMTTYLMWCLIETASASAFIALYLVLISHIDQDYFFYLVKALTTLISVMVFPYSILTLVYSLRDAEKREIAPEGSRLKFYDNRHLLKFVTTSSSVLYIEAEENYINVHYSENGIIKSCQIRNSMKSQEPLFEKAGYIRVHRSYVVNPMHVTQLRKEKEGMYFADLDTGDNISIPVSKKYHEQIAAAM